MMNEKGRKSTGSFYTCNSIADYIAKWAIDKAQMCILEPSFGDGSFIEAATSRFTDLDNFDPDIIGIEIQAEPYNEQIIKHPNIQGYQMDFMDFQTSKKINAVIGNPPYVRLKTLEQTEREKTVNLIKSYGVEMPTSGSLWMPFVIHSTELLASQGKLGFVLPYEITYVRYAFDLWKYLADNFGCITICRIYHDFFPDVDVETVILLAEEKGAKTDSIRYKVFETISDLYEGNTCYFSNVLIDDVINLRKPFERVLISKSISSTLTELQENNKLAKLVQDCKFKIGYVSGNKKFFHPSEESIEKFGINSRNLKKCLLNSKQLDANRRVGIETGGMGNYSYLFYPDEIGDGEKAYIKYGETLGVNEGYKCKKRNPWYLTPDLEIPDVILTVFCDVPKLLLNDGKFYVSNSLLCGTSKVNNCKELICRWYNSITLLSIETTIHSLGGGALVLIPGETDQLEIISDFPKEKIEDTYKKISDFARENKNEEVYNYGDEIVLKEIYGFSDDVINEIRNAITTLRNWRIPEKRRGKKNPLHQNQN